MQASHQTVAVMGLALVAMAEDLGRDMAYRSLEHLLQYGEPHVRRAHMEGYTVTDKEPDCADSCSKYATGGKVSYSKAGHADMTNTAFTGRADGLPASTFHDVSGSDMHVPSEG